jgi:hypothetical protein
MVTLEHLCASRSQKGIVWRFHIEELGAGDWEMEIEDDYANASSVCGTALPDDPWSPRVL